MHVPSRLLLALTLGALPLAASCGSSSSQPTMSGSGAVAGAQTGSPSFPPGASGTSPGPVKKPLQGLVDMGQITFYNNPAQFQPVNDLTDLARFPGAFGGTVINVTWAQLQPTQGAPPDTSVIDAALSAISAYNASSSAPLGAKLRVWGGFAAPEWAKGLNGGPLSVVANKNNAITQSGTIGLWWQPDYLSAWSGLQTQLAAKYDGQPLIREVSISSCASATDEPFISWNDPSTVATLAAKGYTDAAQQACLSAALQHYAAWKSTLLDFPFSPFLPVQLGSSLPTPDLSFTQGLMQACASTGRCVLSNQGLSTNLNANLAQLYAVLDALSGGGTAAPVDFQTVSPALMGNAWCATLSVGVQHHARSIEVWPSTPNPSYQGFTGLSPAQVANLAALVTGGTGYDPANCPDS